MFSQLVTVRFRFTIGYCQKTKGESVNSKLLGQCMVSPSKPNVCGVGDPARWRERLFVEVGQVQHGLWSCWRTHATYIVRIRQVECQADTWTVLSITWIHIQHAVAISISWNSESFQCSSGWCHAYKKRLNTEGLHSHNYCVLRLCSTVKVSMKQFSHMWPSKHDLGVAMHQAVHCDVFNVSSRFSV